MQAAVQVREEGGAHGDSLVVVVSVLRVPVSKDSRGRQPPQRRKVESRTSKP